MDKQKRMASLVKGRKILDIGFAQAPNKYLQGEIIGIDIQKTKKPENYSKVLRLNLNTDRIPYPDNTFDTVLCGDVIEHVENPSQLLRECNRVLKKQGKLILSTPHANHWWTTLHNWIFPFIKDRDVGEHLSNWTKLDMIRLLKKNGFKVKKIYGVSFDIPLLKLKINFVIYHMFSLVLIYECIKEKKPITGVFFGKNGKIKLAAQKRLTI